MTSAGKMTVHKVTPAIPPDNIVPNGPISSLRFPANNYEIIYIKTPETFMGLSYIRIFGPPNT